VIQEYQLTGPRKDRGVAFLMGSLLPLQTSWSGSGEFGTPFEWNEELCWRNQLDCSDWMSALALDGLADELVEVNQMGGYLLLFTAHGVSRDQLPVAHMELDRAVKRLREWVVARPSYRVTLRGFQSGKGEVFQLQQTVSEGAKATWMCGAERTYIHQFDTEVAQYAAIHDPRVMSVMEGSLIEMTLEPDIQGHLQVQFDARLNVPQGSVEIHSASPLHGDFQRPVYQTTRFSGMQPLSAAKPGELTASFGGQGDDSITIVLSVAPVN
jgi:hypothetical protein